MGGSFLEDFGDVCPVSDEPVAAFYGASDRK
jgi:hypothetical protein